MASNDLISQYPSHASVFHSRYYLLHTLHTYVVSSSSSSSSSSDSSTPSLDLLHTAFTINKKFAAELAQKAHQSNKTTFSEAADQSGSDREPTSTVMDPSSDTHVSRALDRLVDFFFSPADMPLPQTRQEILLDLWKMFDGRTQNSEATIPAFLAPVILQQYTPLSVTDGQLRVITEFVRQCSTLCDSDNIPSPPSAPHPSTWEAVLTLDLDADASLCAFLGLHESLVLHRRRLLCDLLACDPLGIPLSTTTLEALTPAKKEVVSKELRWIGERLVDRLRLFESLTRRGISLPDTTSDVRVFRALLRNAYIILTALHADSLHTS